MFWTNVDGLWFKCSCMREGKLIGRKYTKHEMQELLDKHKAH